MKHITFFIVDDDSDDVELFKEVAREENPSLHFQTASDGEEALQKLQTGSWTPDVIFLDLNMPRMGGKECLRALKEDAQLRHIPVIMYTTSSQSSDIEETMMNGAVCFITKPSSVKDLRFIISSIARSLPGNLDKALQHLSNSSNAFIVC